MVINQVDQYFKFVKDMLLKEVISELFIYSAYFNHNLPTIQSSNREVM